MNLFKVILISLGTISLGIGIMGVVIPGLPTTPFLLLTAGLYVRSSDKLYQKLIANRLIGSFVLEFYSNKGMTKKTKLYAIILMWLMISASCLLFITVPVLKLIVLITGIIGTIVMGFIVRTAHKPK